MPVKDPKELFVVLLSDARQSTERTTRLMQEISQIAQDPQVKEALEESEFVAGQTLAKLDQCFKLIGEKPAKLSRRLHDVLVEDLRAEAADIQSPVARHLYILAKAVQLIHFRVSEYIALIAAAEISGNRAVGELLESCLADRLMAVERARRLIRNIVETKVQGRSAA